MAKKASKGAPVVDTRISDELDDTVSKISTIDAEISATKVEIDATVSEIAMDETKLKIQELEDSLVGLRETPDGTIRVRGVDGANSRSAVVLAFNHKPIFCTEDGYVADNPKPWL
jgi:hypothetical protein